MPNQWVRLAAGSNVGSVHHRRLGRKVRKRLAFCLLLPAANKVVSNGSDGLHYSREVATCSGWSLHFRLSYEVTSCSEFLKQQLNFTFRINAESSKSIQVPQPAIITLPDRSNGGAPAVAANPIERLRRRT